MGLWALFWRHWCVRCASFEPAKHTVATAGFDLMLPHRLGLAASNVDLWGGWHRSKSSRLQQVRGQGWRGASQEVRSQRCARHTNRQVG
jgi:hypothetical protein